MEDPTGRIQDANIPAAMAATSAVPAGLQQLDLQHSSQVPGIQFYRLKI